MRLIYAQGFSKSEKEEWRAIIFNNILSAFKVILDAMEELGIEFGNKDNDVSAIFQFGRSVSVHQFKRLGPTKQSNHYQ
jgi:guanine nucleotide-binding protein subunit alpha, other